MKPVVHELGAVLRQTVFILEIYNDNDFFQYYIHIQTFIKSAQWIMRNKKLSLHSDLWFPLA